MSSHAKSLPATVRIKRAYDKADTEDGYRVFIDRLWPRGIPKENLTFDEWNKDLAPSPALRKWFGHKIENWEKFRESYKAELSTPEQRKRMIELIAAAQGRSITLIYAAHDTEHNHALVLAEAINSLY
jgi:uncharacterized protein YeaO (DUF488 family)